MASNGALDMALDDVIKQNRSKRGPRGARGGRGGGARKSNGGPSTAPAKASPAGGAAGVRKRGSRAAGTPKKAALATASKAVAAQAAAQVASNPFNQIRKISVSNLGPQVTQNDIMELFKQVGPVRTAQVQCDSQGRFKGTATVIFKNPGSAYKAYQQYHNRTLDGKPMKIELLINPDAGTFKPAVVATPPKNTAANAAAKAAGAARSGGSGSTKRGGGRPKRGRGGAQGSGTKSTATPAQLDADMDVYMEGAK